VEASKLQTWLSLIFWPSCICSYLLTKLSWSRHSDQQKCSEVLYCNSVVYMRTRVFATTHPPVFLDFYSVCH
jgi:hypothetical protein